MARNESAVVIVSKSFCFMTYNFSVCFLNLNLWVMVQ